MNKCKNLPVFYKFYDFDTCKHTQVLNECEFPAYYAFEKCLQSRTTYSRAHHSWLNVSSPMFETQTSQRWFKSASSKMLNVFSLTQLVAERASLAWRTTNLQCTEISQLSALPICPELGAPLFCSAPSQNQPCDTLY